MLVTDCLSGPVAEPPGGKAFTGYAKLWRLADFLQCQDLCRFACTHFRMSEIALTPHTVPSGMTFGDSSPSVDFRDAAVMAFQTTPTHNPHLRRTIALVTAQKLAWLVREDGFFDFLRAHLPELGIEALIVLSLDARPTSQCACCRRTAGAQPNNRPDDRALVAYSRNVAECVDCHGRCSGPGVSRCLVSADIKSRQRMGAYSTYE